MVFLGLFFCLFFQNKKKGVFHGKQSFVLFLFFFKSALVNLSWERWRKLKLGRIVGSTLKNKTDFQVRAIILTAKVLVILACSLNSFNCASTVKAMVSDRQRFGGGIDLFVVIKL